MNQTFLQTHEMLDIAHRFAVGGPSGGAGKVTDNLGGSQTFTSLSIYKFYNSGLAGIKWIKVNFTTAPNTGYHGVNEYDYLNQLFRPPYGVSKTLNDGDSITYIFRFGLQGGAPTYFETLDKLDQWSTAQYIPNSSDKLNL